MLILGIDPGSRKTGYGIVQSHKNTPVYVASGVIRLDGEDELAQRLGCIFESLCRIIDHYQPTDFAIEQVFMANNASSALKLGQARGAAIVAARHNNLPVAEYEARKVKQAIVGTGAADKAQVQQMVKHLLKLPHAPQEDAADALAIAICHMNTSAFLVSTAGAMARGRYRRGRLT